MSIEVPPGYSVQSSAAIEKAMELRTVLGLSRDDLGFTLLLTARRVEALEAERHDTMNSIRLMGARVDDLTKQLSETEERHQLELSRRKMVCDTMQAELDEALELVKVRSVQAEELRRELSRVRSGRECDCMGLASEVSEIKELLTHAIDLLDYDGSDDEPSTVDAEECAAKEERPGAPPETIWHVAVDDVAAHLRHRSVYTRGESVQGLLNEALLSDDIFETAVKCLDACIREVEEDETEKKRVFRANADSVIGALEWAYEYPDLRWNYYPEGVEDDADAHEDLCSSLDDVFDKAFVRAERRKYRPSSEKLGFVKHKLRKCKRIPLIDLAQHAILAYAFRLAEQQGFKSSSAQSEPKNDAAPSSVGSVLVDDVVIGEACKWNVRAASPAGENANVYPWRRAFGMLQESLLNGADGCLSPSLAGKSVEDLLFGAKIAQQPIDIATLCTAAAIRELEPIFQERGELPGAAAKYVLDRLWKSHVHGFFPGDTAKGDPHCIYGSAERHNCMPSALAMATLRDVLHRQPNPDPYCVADRAFMALCYCLQEQNKESAPA